VPGRLILKLGFALLPVLTVAGSALAAPPSQYPAANNADWTVLAVAFTFLLPVGLILLSAAAFPEEQAVSTATGALVAWGLAIVAYFAIGFAFHFGGIAVFYDDPDLAGLYWEYSLLDTTWGTGWGMIGLKGFFMLDEASTPGALTLFLSQLPLLGVAVLIPYFALQGRAGRWVAPLLSLLMGGLIYPIIGNWNWAGGWLANLGGNLAMGHGLLDSNGGGQVALAGAAAALAATLVFRVGQADEAPDVTEVSAPRRDTAEDKTQPHDRPVSVPMPSVHLPLLGLLGATLLVVGWLGTGLMTHLPIAADTQPAVIATNLVLGALGGALSTGLYSWFTTDRLNPLMSARGMLAGLVAAAAGAAFIPAWSALAAGLVTGLLLPPAIYLFDRALPMKDTASAVATFGLPALLGLLLPALAADGHYGVAWNGVGRESYLDVAGQGVSGLLTAPGFAMDWPGQLYAQLIGVIAIFAWSFGLSWLLLQVLTGLVRAWARSGLEFGAPPAPVGAEEEAPLAGDEAQGTDKEEGPGLLTGRGQL
jgi:Amt family ammonium transporter